MSFRKIRWTKLTPHQSTRVLPSTIPGLHFVQDKICAMQYFALVHTDSGKQVGSFRGKPVTMKAPDFVAAVDAAIAPLGIDWLQPENALGLDDAKGQDVRRAITQVRELA